MSKTEGYRPKSREEIQRNMSAIRSTGNRTETALRKMLHGRGFRYRKYSRDLPGRPDIVFPTEKVAVFVDGDYWHCRVLVEHGMAALEARIKTHNRAYWLEKFQRRVARDAEISAELRKRGWRVVRLWESDVKADLGAAAQQVADVVLQCRKIPRVRPD